MKKKRLKLTPEQSAKLNDDIRRLAATGKIDREIGESLGIDTRTIAKRRLKLGIKANRKTVWTDERVKFLIDNYHLGGQYVATKLGVSFYSVHSKVRSLGFLSCTDPWDDFEDEYIQSVINEVAEKLERKPEAIAKRFLWLSQGNDDE